MVDAFEPGDHIIRRRFGVLELGKGDGCCAESWGSRGEVGFLPLRECIGLTGFLWLYLL